MINVMLTPDDVTVLLMTLDFNSDLRRRIEIAAEAAASPIRLQGDAVVKVGIEVKKRTEVREDIPLELRCCFTGCNNRRRFAPSGKLMYRGLCYDCHQLYSGQVLRGETSWKTLLRFGKILPCR